MRQDRRIHGSTTKHSKRFRSSLGAVARGLGGLLAALALITAVGAWTPSAQAASFGWAYLWADQPFSPSYTPTPSYRFNSTGATNTVVRAGVGVYTAILPNLGVVGGTVHVTAYGSGTETCKVAGWNANGSNQEVNVLCFTRTGTLVDTRFTMTYAHPSSSVRPMAFLWADQPTSPSYTPSASYQFNSSGATNTMVRTGVGVYTAKLPNLGTPGGHVQVTAFGWGSQRCKVASWGPSGSIQQVNVRCVTSAGAPVDTRFTLTYVSGISLVGSPCCTGLPGTASAYAWANQPTSPSYTPSLPYQFNDSGASNTITRSGVGAYGVQFPGMALGNGDAQVTAYGSGSEYCKVAYWTSSGAGVQVRCFSSSGLPVDTYFDVTFLFSYLTF